MVLVVASLGGCVLRPLLDSREKRQAELTRSINEENVRRADALRQAFMQYYDDMGMYAKSFLDFERYLNDSRVYEDVKIERKADDSFHVSFKISRRDRTYSIVQFMIGTKKTKQGSEVAYERPMRDLVQQRVYAMDGHRAGRLNGKKIERTTGKNGDTVVKERNHDGYVE